jgi:hypothetical protein
MLIVTWKPNLGPSIVFNATDNIYPIDGEGTPFQVEVEFSDPSVRKPQQAGEHPTFGYPGSTRVILDGHIIGSTAANFWSRRNDFLVALTPPAGELTSRRHGTLTIDDDDMAEPMQAFCRVINRVANLENLDVMRCPYMVTWKSFDTYFVGTQSGKAYLIG